METVFKAELGKNSFDFKADQYVIELKVTDPKVISNLQEMGELLEVTAKKWYKRRTRKQENLLRMIERRIAQATENSIDQVHEYIKSNDFWPVEWPQHLNKPIKKSSKQLTTVENALAVEHAVDLAASVGAQYRDIYVLFMDWQAENNVEIPYFDAEDYRKRHRFCEACGDWYESLDLHHIKTRGSGGTDNPSNMLALCRIHHGQYHNGTPDDFMKEFRHLEPRIRRALDVS